MTTKDAIIELFEKKVIACNGHAEAYSLLNRFYDLMCNADDSRLKQLEKRIKKLENRSK